MVKQNKTDKYLLILYMLGFFVLASTMALKQPYLSEPPLFAGPPDEHARLLIPWYICEHGVIPTGFEEEIRIPGYGFSYGLYNVFPYIVQGFAMRLVSFFTKSEQILLCAGRFVNVFFGTWMSYVVYKISKRVFTDKKLQWMFCIGIMYLPECMFVHTYINTDSMNLLSTAMIVYAWIWAYQEGFTLRNDLYLALGIILCALSYYNAYGFILCSVLFLLGHFLHRESERKSGKFSYDWKKMLRHGCLIGAVVLLGIGWWFVRAYILFDGDFLGLKTRTAMAIQYAVPEVNPLNSFTYKDQGISLFTMFKETDFFTVTTNTFIAAFGSLSIMGNVWIYRFYKLFFIAASVACLVLPDQKEQKKKRYLFDFSMLISMFSVFALMIIYAYTIDMQRQGRYLLPAVVPIYYFLLRGVEKGFDLKWVPEWLKKIGTGVFVFGVVFICFWMVYGVSLPVFKMVNK